MQPTYSLIINIIVRKGNVRDKVSPSNISRTVWPRITELYKDIHIDQLCSHAGYDVNNFFRTVAMAKKTVENAATDGFGGHSREMFKQGLQNFTHLLGTIGLRELSDLTSLTASVRLQNAIRYCTKVRKTGASGKESNNSATVYIQLTNFTRKLTPT